MARYRFSRLAEADLAHILTTSEGRWGATARRRYAVTLAAAMRKVAAEPLGAATRDRAELSPGIRSFHRRHARRDDPTAKVRRPVHVVYYRIVTPGLVDIVRVLHERMEPRRHIDTDDDDLG